MNLGKRLKLLRKNTGLTMEQAARAMGISRSALSLYEIDKREPNIETLNKIAHFYGVSISEIVDEKPTVETEPKELKKYLHEADLQIEGLTLSSEDKEQIYNIILGVYWKKIHKKD